MKHTNVLILICFGSLVKGASKYYDGENRPYEFGYNIEGNQHRHEAKDENGIITGEFGFITADGVYHVTAYATDENGNFKILFMKNIKIGLPGEPGTKPVPKELQPELPVRLPPKSQPYPTITLNPSDTPSCGGCSIPKKESKEMSPSRSGSIGSSVPKVDVRFGENESNRPSGSSSRPGGEKGKTQRPVGNGRAQRPESPSFGAKQGIRSESSQGGSASINQNPREGTESPALFKPLSKKINGPISPKSTNNLGGEPSFNQGTIGASNADGTTDNKSPTERKPVGASGKASRPIGQDMNQLAGDLMGILYKFNYTVGYHGHHEEGDFVGAKDGGYFFVGRDGLRRTVDYQANEFGYQPHIVQENAKEDDIPRIETEKEKGLQGYEFKWFNRNKL